MKANKTAPEGRQAITRADWLLGCGLAGAALLLYTVMLADGLLPGDSGEFQTLAWLGGHAHPSGYSLYLGLARLFTSLPWLDEAARISWQAAVMGALGVGLIFGYSRWLTGRRLPALATAAALALSQTFWSQAIIAEVYTTSSAALLAALWLLNQWQVTKQDRWLVLGAALTGLAPGLHLSGFFWLPAAAMALIASPERKSMPRLLRAGAALGLGLLAGLLLAAGAFWLTDQTRPPSDYFGTVVLPARSALNLSEADLADTGARLRFAWSGRQFQFRLQDNLWQQMPGAVLAFLRGLGGEIPWPLLPLLPLGLFWLWRRHRPVALSLLTFLGLHWLYAVNYDVWDQYVFYLPDYLVLMLFLAAGITALEEWLSSRWPSPRVNPAWLLLPLLLLWQLPGPLTARRAGAVPFPFPAYAITPYSQSRLTPALNAAIADLPQQALVLTQWSELYPLIYSAQRIQARSDLQFIQIYRTPGSEAIPESQQAWVSAAVADRPVFLTVPVPELAPAGYTLQTAVVGGHDWWQIVPVTSE